MLEHKLREIPSVDDVIAKYKHLMINAPYLLYVKKIKKTFNIDLIAGKGVIGDRHFMNIILKEIKLH